ncbi:MAG TPA: hypothetical protein PKN47_22720 [Nitrospira sp.]|nr:hypothetical protein [Nitrospira sp.]
MLKILIVEDQPQKLERVLSALQDVVTPESAHVESARDATSAKRLLRDAQYDLLVLDIALPDRQDSQPKKDGGILLLDEVLRRDIYKTPRHIVGLTGYQDILDTSGPKFAEDLWLILLYEPSSDAWIEQLQRKVRHILLTEQKSPTTSDYLTQLCIVTALQDPELKAVLRLPWSWQKRQLQNDTTIYHRGYYTRDGRTHDVVAAAAPRMGMTWAAALSMKMISVFRPRYIAIVGILAGMRGQCELGDIVVADPGWDYGSGKYLRKDDGNQFEIAPYQIALNSSIRGKLSSLAQEGEVLDEIRHGWQGNSPKTILKMHLGPVGSGAAVLADSTICEDVKKQHRKVIGIDMETYGVLAAAEESQTPQPKAFAIKSVSDFADHEKNDDFREYAAFTSAMCLKLFAERFL